MIPEGWRYSKISTIAEPITSGSRGWAVYYSDFGSPFIRITNLRRSSILPDYGPMKYVALPEGSNEGRRTELRQGDILVSITADLGVIGYIETQPETPSYISQHVARVRIKSRAADTRFVAYQLAAPRHARIIERLNDSGAKAGLNLPTIASIPVLLPSLPEQRRIAEILHTWDRAIETVEALIANARAQKQALMQKLLLGKWRLPGFSDPWEWAAFADVFGRVKTKNAEGNTNVLTISAQHGLISQVEYFNKTVASDDVRGYTLLQRGDFAYNKSYSDGYPMGAIKPLDRYDSGIVSSLYICFRLTKRGFGHDFFRHYFEAGLFNREIAAIAQEGARNHGLLNVSVVEFFETSLHIPKRDEQVAIAKVINAAEAEEKACQTQLTALRQEKAALMQQLLTGKRRVKLPEREVA